MAVIGKIPPPPAALHRRCELQSSLWNRFVFGLFEVHRGLRPRPKVLQFPLERRLLRDQVGTSLPQHGHLVVNGQLAELLRIASLVRILFEYGACHGADGHDEGYGACEDYGSDGAAGIVDRLRGGF